MIEKYDAILTFYACMHPHYIKKNQDELLTETPR